MFNNTALDVVIGLLFIFLLYSLLATIIQEIIAQFLDLRARMLVKTIRVLLDDRKETQSNVVLRFFNHIGQNIYHWFCPLDENKLSKAFYKHPSIKYLAQSSWKSKPSYIGTTNFSATLIKLLRGKDYDGTEPQMNAIYRTLFEQNQVVSGESANELRASIDPETLTHLKELYTDSHKDIERFKASLEKWFDETMERAGGWYKKQTQWILLLIGFLVAITFNVDTIAITKLLSKDETARANMVQLAINATPKYDTLISRMNRINRPDTTYNTAANNAQDTTAIVIKDTVLVFTNKELSDAYKTITADIDKASNVVGLGWPNADSCKVCDSLESKLACCGQDTVLAQNLKKKRAYYNTTFNCAGNPYQKGGFTSILGWLLTALAISLGAPFWFDMLNKVIQLRSSVAKPKDADKGGGSSKIDDTSGSSPSNRVG